MAARSSLRIAWPRSSQMGVVALHEACTSGHTECVKELLDSGAWVQARDYNVCVAAGTSLHIPSLGYTTAQPRASPNVRSPCVASFQQALVSNNRCCPSSSLRLLAAGPGVVSVLQIFSARPSTFSAASRRWLRCTQGTTPLHCAAERQGENADTIKLLLDRGGGIDLRDNPVRSSTPEQQLAERYYRVAGRWLRDCCCCA